MDAEDDDSGMFVKVPVCVGCGHKHFPESRCADHQWRDSCPYEGTDCAE